MRFQPIYDIAELCARKGLHHAVLCPGSRCAPLLLSFVRHPDIKTYTFSDERSAAFVALGMSQQIKKPTVLICTSGSAVYNFAPAVAEAFFNQLPLVILTADRPAEWVNQHDGQTIYQAGIFGPHVKQSYQLPQSYDHADDQWLINRMVNDAVNLALREPRGPVHINAPFREPLYPSKDDAITFSQSVRVIEDVPLQAGLPDAILQKLNEELSRYQHILIVAGQADPDKEIVQALRGFTSRNNIPVVGEIISNLHPLENLIRHADNFLGDVSGNIKKSLQPDLLITFGKSVLSKNLKTFLRKYPSAAHWHISPGKAATDTFQHLTTVIPLEPSVFFSGLARQAAPDKIQGQKTYYDHWQTEEQRSVKIIGEFFPQKERGEFELVHDVIRQLPPDSRLHLANSMSVRYANFIGLETNQQNVGVYCNRGTSGIDGCSSTAVGHALACHATNVLITGDLAFFYDRNAFWHNYNLPDLRVVLLNNHGGVIFKMIDGPKELPESDEYFVTQQKLNASRFCEEAGFEYLTVDPQKDMPDLVRRFLEPGSIPRLLEIETNAQTSKKIFDSFKQKIKISYEV